MTLLHFRALLALQIRRVLSVACPLLLISTGLLAEQPGSSDDQWVVLMGLTGGCLMLAALGWALEPARADGPGTAPSTADSPGD